MIANWQWNHQKTQLDTGDCQVQLSVTRSALDPSFLSPDPENAAR